MTTSTEKLLKLAKIFQAKLAQAPLTKGTVVMALNTECKKRGIQVFKDLDAVIDSVSGGKVYVNLQELSSLGPEFKGVLTSVCSQLRCQLVPISGRKSAQYVSDAIKPALDRSNLPVGVPSPSPAPLPLPSFAVPPKTPAEIIKIQTKLGVVPDGKWGPVTQKAYEAYMTKEKEMVQQLFRINTKP